MKRAIRHFFLISSGAGLIVLFIVLVLAQSSRRNIVLVYAVDPVKTPELIEVTLPYLDKSGYLKGDFADVYLSTEEYSEFGDSILSPGGKHDVCSKEGDFRFAHDEEKLSQVNVYYHINKMHDFFADNLGYSLEGPVKCYVLHKPLRNQCSHIPLKNDIRFGVYDKGVNPALSADLIYHEYTHVVMESIFSLDNEDESAAIREAYADYFSCSIRNDPVSGEYSAPFLKEIPSKYSFPRDGLILRTTEDGSALRNLKNRKRYPEDLVYEEHRDSEILSGAFWDLRKALGQGKADALIFEGYKRMYELPDRYFVGLAKGTKCLVPYFSSVREGIIIADKKIFAGKHKKIIQEIFEARGIPDKPYRYHPSLAFGYQTFGKGIKIGWYPMGSGSFREMKWLGVYRIGKKQRLYGRIPAKYKSLELRLYNEHGESIKDFPSHTEIVQGKDKDYKIFLVELDIPEDLSPGNYSFQFVLLMSEIREPKKSNAVSIRLLKK